MKGLNEFAHSQTPDGSRKHNIEYAGEVIEYLNEVSDLRPFFKPIPMGLARAKSIKIKQKEGIAAQIIGNAEVPRAADVEREIYIRLHRNASGYDINYDDRIENADDPQFESNEYNRALERLDLKERIDCTAAMLAGAGTGTAVPEAVFDIDVVRNAITEFNSQPSNVRQMVKADTIFLSEKVYQKIVDSDNFKYIPDLYKDIILKGDIGNVIAGLKTVIIDELDSTIIIAAIKQEPLWLAEGSGTIVAAYSDGRHITDSVDFRHDEEALCAKPDYLSAIQIVP